MRSCFPGQGVPRDGNGQDIAEAFPAAREVYRLRVRGPGLDLERLCFETPLEELVETEVQQPALVTTSLAILAAMRERGLEADVVVGHSVGEFAALSAAGVLAPAEAIGLVRERARDGRGGTPAPGRDGGDPRPGRRGGREALPADRRRVARELQLPGAGRRLRELDAVEECCAEAESLGARRAVRLKVSGAFHSPLVARAADRLRPALDRVRFAEPLSPFMSTVTAKVEPAQKLAALLVDQLTAPVRFTQAATELIRARATTFVEVGPGNVLSGLVKRIDRGVKTISVNGIESLERAQEALAR